LSIVHIVDNRLYDAKGNLRDWWSGDDGKKYEARANVIIKQVGS